MQALLIFRGTWDVVRAAAAIMNLLGGGKRIAKVATGRGRWCGPHNTSGEGCRCTTDRGHQYSRLHVGIPFSGRPRHSAAAGCASRIVGFQGESRRPHVGAAVALQIRRVCRPRRWRRGSYGPNRSGGLVGRRRGAPLKHLIEPHDHLRRRQQTRLRLEHTFEYATVH
jgi:hypothetical protein